MLQSAGATGTLAAIAGGSAIATGAAFGAAGASQVVENNN